MPRLTRLTQVSKQATLISLILWLFMPNAFAQSIICTPSTNPAPNTGTAPASITNPAGIAIARQNQGEHGIVASDSASEQNAMATNRGTIILCGDVLESNDEDGNPTSTVAVAVSATANESSQSTATASNEAGGTIETRGRASLGMLATTDNTGKATAINRGSIRTTGGGYDRKVRQTDLAFGLAVADGIEVFANGEGAAEVINESGASIETTGPGARGIRVAGESSGAVSVTNRGRITTRGNPYFNAQFQYLQANGIRLTSGGTGASTMINEGTIETFGVNADAVYVRSQAGLSSAVNRGRIIAHSRGAAPLPGRTFERNSRGMHVWAGLDSSRAVNEKSGTIETRGHHSHAVITGINGNNQRYSVSTNAINQGTVTTRGDFAYGIYAYGENGGTADNPNTIRAVNEQTGSIATHGNESHALVAWLWDNGDSDSFGTIIAENHGAITTTGDYAPTDDRKRVIGVEAGQFRGASRPRGKSGDSLVVNTGTVQATGKLSYGLSAFNYASGKSTIKMTDGSVVAGTANTNYGVGVYAAVQTSAANDAVDDVDIDIQISGSETTVTAHSAPADDPLTTGHLDTLGTGIWAEINPVESTQPDRSGHISVLVSNGATVTAKRAAFLEGGTTAFTLKESTLTGSVVFDNFADNFTVQGGLVDGAIEFANGNDQLTITNRGYITGNLDFGDGSDTLLLDVDGYGTQASKLGGVISGLEVMTKRGTGDVLVRDATSEGTTLVVEEGMLIIAGHLNLGSAGTVTIRDNSRLSFRIGANSNGKITAGQGVEFLDSKPEIFVEIAPELTGDQQQTVNARLMQGVDLLGDSTNFTQKAEENAPAENTEASVRTVGGKQIGTAQTHGSTTITANARQGATIEVAAKSATRPAPDNDDNAYLGAAALAVLWWLMRDKEETNLVDYESGNSNAASPYSPLKNQVTDSPFVPWVRHYTDNSIAPVQGMALGIDTQFGNSGRVRLSAMPEATGKSNTGRLHLNESSSFEGHNFMLESRFGRDSIFATIHASQGQYHAHSSFRSNATQGRLSGNFNMVQNHFQASAGIQFEPLNGLELISTIGIYRGSVQQSEFVAGNSVLTTTLPSNTRKYHGWKFGLNAQFKDWIGTSGDLKLQPQFGLSTYRTYTDGPSSLSLSQSERSGALRFTEQLRLQGLPQTVFAFNAGLKVQKSRDTHLKLDYAVISMREEIHHGAFGKLQINF